MFLMPNGFDGLFTSGPPHVVPFFLLVLSYILDSFYLEIMVCILYILNTLFYYFSQATFEYILGWACGKSGCGFVFKDLYAVVSPQVILSNFKWHRTLELSV